MINISNSTSKNNPSWLLEAPADPDQPTRPSGSAGTREAASSRPAADAAGGHALSAVTVVGRLLLSWLAALPGRLGDWLFAANDTEAYWNDWQITKTRGGLGRSYRDPRFDLLAECPKCHGAGGPAKLPCPPCLGTGRITLGEG